MELQKTIGIVLQTTPFKERDKILSIFTPEWGLIKLYAKGKRKSNPEENALTSPLTEAEYYFRQRNSEIFSLVSGEIICQHLFLRENYKTLDVALKLMKANLSFLWPTRQTPRLYLLLSSFLKKLHLALDPEVLYSTFLLKTLLHEGVLQLETECCKCEKKLVETYRFGGEVFCPTHAPRNSSIFSKQEELSCSFLAKNRLFSEIKNIQFPTSFFTKIETLFLQWAQNP